MSASVVRLLPLDELARRWTEIEALLKRATDRSACYEPIDLLQLAMLNQGQIWLIECDGALVSAVYTQIKVYPRRRIFEVLFLGGDGMARWLRDLLATLDEFGRKNGCADMQAYGREGWAKLGFERDGVILTRRL